MPPARHMTPMVVFECADHGYFADGPTGRNCPACGGDGRAVIVGDRRRRLSTFIGGALRHFPDDVGLDLDERGWVTYGAVVDAVLERYDWASREHVQAVVATDPKGRFERQFDGSDDGRIRAAYGHSVDVDLEPTDAPVPDELYHGTAPERVVPITTEGLRPVGRQLVHLSDGVDAARDVGRRHASRPVVLAIDAAGMLDDGHRVTKRGRAVYTAMHVPPRYVEESER